MAVSKRLRYEIFRRDNHMCRYCGGAAPDVTLTVDHVLPVALGGGDDPSNLVAACKDCNAGKAASNPDEPLIDQVSDDAVRWAKAVDAAVRKVHADFAAVQKARDEFDSAWSKWTYSNGSVVPRPANWPDTVDLLRARGLSSSLMEECIRIAMARPGIEAEQRFKYFCGVSWRKVSTIDSLAKEIGSNAKLESARECDIYGLRSFPAVFLAGELMKDVIYAMGGSEEIHREATNTLWAAMPEAHKAYMEAYADRSATSETVDYDELLVVAADVFGDWTAPGIYEIQKISGRTATDEAFS